MSGGERPDDETGIGTIEDTAPEQVTSSTPAQEGARASLQGASASTSEASKGLTPSGAPAADGDWRSTLLRTADGAIKASVGNLATILRHDNAWRGRLAFDGAREKSTIDGRPIDANDVAQIRAAIEATYRIAPSASAIKDAIRVAVGARKGADDGGGKKAKPKVEPKDDWQKDFTPDKYGDPKGSPKNLALIFRNDERWKGRLTFNEMSSLVELDGVPLDDGGFARAREQVEADWGIVPSVDALTSAIRVVAEEHRVHPVRDYLSALKWDGGERINEIVDSQLGIRTALDVQFLRKTMIAAVARAFKPGCKVDTVLIFFGLQGTKKSSFWRELAGPAWFCDSHMDIHNKDGLLTLHSAWIYEWGEIESIINRRDAADNKRFLTSPSDTFREPYARSASAHARSVIIIGTTNEKEVLVDHTGSRRFWILHVRHEIDVDFVRKERDQLWAEAVAAYRAGEQWWLTEEQELERTERSGDHEVQDPWEMKIEVFCLTHQTQAFAMSQLLLEACGLEVSLQNPANSRRAANFLRRLGFDNQKTGRGGEKQQRLWRRMQARASDDPAPERPAVLFE